MTEKVELDTQVSKNRNGSSNLEKIIHNALHFSSKLNTLWDSSNYTGKQKLQFLLLPEGICYHKKNETVRTKKVNSIFSYFLTLAGIATKSKNGKLKLDLKFPVFVERTGEMSNFFVTDIIKFSMV